MSDNIEEMLFALMKNMDKMVEKISKTMDTLSTKIEKLEKSVINVTEKAKEKKGPDPYQQQLETSTQALLKRTIDLLEDKTKSGGKKK
ncbi:MAG: hypothetical protein ACW976_02950 [Candidatus Ranarchaeia archaeon]|jgi:hypothetical protein